MWLNLMQCLAPGNYSTDSANKTKQKFYWMPIKWMNVSIKHFRYLLMSKHGIFGNVTVLLFKIEKHCLRVFLPSSLGPWDSWILLDREELRRMLDNGRPSWHKLGYTKLGNF